MSRLFLNRWLFLSFAFVFSFSYAASSSYTVQGNVYRVVEYVSSDANEIKVSTVVKGAAANEPYAARVVPIKSSKVSSFFKPQLGSLIRASAWWFAFMGIVESAGWAIDELKGQVVTVNRSASAGYFWMVDGWPSSASDTPQAAVQYYIDESSSTLTLKSLTAGTTQASAVISDPWVSWTLNVKRVACSAGATSPASCLADYKPATLPVSDADFYSAVATQMAADPAYAAQAFTDPATGKPYAELFDPVPYIPGLTAADEALVNCYISGQLQMVNSQTACYVATQAEYDQVKQQAEALAAGKTPDGVADALNSEMEQPITQAQYEDSNLKTETVQATSLATSLAPALDPFNQLKIDSDFVLDKVTNPSEPPSSLSFFTWSLPTGTCSGFDVDFSVGNGKLHTSKRVNEFCEFYSTVAHPLLFWFLNILTFLYVWWVWDRSVSDMAR